MNPSDVLAVPGQIVNQLRRSASKSRFAHSLSPGEFVGDLRRSASSASFRSRYGRALSPGNVESQHRRSASAETRGSYAPLVRPSQEIRLIILEPALSDAEDVRCELTTGDIRTTRYEALSYAWGDATDKVPILLGGGRFLVTRNLKEALRSLRTLSNDPSHKRWLWIDALCIDQENDDERSEQVGRMGSIYKSASRILVWLGNYYEKEDDSVHFETGVWGFRYQSPGNFETTYEAFKLAEALFEQSRVAADMKAKKPKKPGHSPTMNLHIWGFLSILCQRYWFRRLWVIQEITMARKATICCGRLELRWRVLEGAGDRIAAYFESPSEWPFLAKLRFIDEMTSFAGNISIVGLWDLDKSNVLSIIVHTQYSKTTDPRDRLFALRGLLSNEDTDIVVDYSQPVEEVYWNWALRRIRRTGSLDVLTLCTDSNYQSLKKNFLPSWVPNLRNVDLVDDTFFALANGFSQNHEQAYAAAGTTKCRDISVDEHDFKMLSRERSLRGSILSVQGFHVGTIEKRVSISNKFDIDYTTDNLPHAMTYMVETISKHLTASVYSQSGLYDAFLDALFKGWKWYAGSYPTATLGDRYKVWCGHASIPIDFEPYMIPNVRRRDYLGSMEMILRLMLRVSDIFITSNGLIGSMSKHCQAKAGDKVYVLYGGNAPFILRPLDAGGKRVYQMRCACFLNGYMQGEAIHQGENGELKLDTLHLV